MEAMSQPPAVATPQLVTTAQELTSLYGEVGRRAAGKVHGRLDRHDRDFVAHSPFLVLATAQAGGLLDVSPRGDRPGFVHVTDDGQLVLPDRPGNNRIDSLLNVLTDPRVSMIFLVPGVGHTLRINGTAVISTDPDLRELGAVDGRLPVTVLLVRAVEVLYQCQRALLRSRLWAPEGGPADLASLDEVLADQVPGLSLDQSLALGEAGSAKPLW